MKTMKTIKTILLTVSLIVFSFSFINFGTLISLAQVHNEFYNITEEEQINKYKHVKKLEKYEKELDTIGYLNEDGTETVNIYAEPVKFLSNDGKIIEKDLSIVNNKESKKGYAYKVAENDFQIYFNDSINDKMMALNFKGNDLTLTVFNEGKVIEDIFNNKAIIKNTKNKNEDNKIVYPNAFGENIDIQFTSLYNGIKEDIVINKYDGQNKFTFKINFGNLIPKLENGIIYLYDNDEKEPVLIMPPIYVHDSSENRLDEGYSRNNKIELEKINGSEYLISIIADKEFLENPNTVYPVYIDPSITVPSTKHFDAPVYSKYPNENFYYELYNCFGYTANYYYGQVYVKFDISSLSSVRYDNIMSAYYHCREMTAIDSNVIAEAYLVTGDWSETGITWNNKPGNLGEKLGAKNIQGDTYNNTYWYDFYITSAVMAWKQGTPNYGVCIKERNNSSWRAFASKEYSSYVPSLVVTYISENEYTPGLGAPVENELTTFTKDFYIKNVNSKLYLTNAGNYNEANVYQSIFTGNNNQIWRFEYRGNGYFYIIPLNATDKGLDVYCGPTEPTGNMDSTNIQIHYRYTDSANQLWRLKRNWNGSYQIASKLSNNGKGIVTQYASYNNNANVILHTFSVDYIRNDDWTLEPVSREDADFYTFTNSDGGYGINTTTEISTMRSSVSALNYSNFELQDCNPGDAYRYMKSDSIWYFTGHGHNSLLSFRYKDANNIWVSGSIQAFGSANTSTDYYINKMDVNDLSQLYLAMFFSCLTGTNNGDSNMIGMMYKRGSHFTMGFNRETYLVADYEWSVAFFERLKNHYSIYDSMEYADSVLYSKYGINDTIGNHNERHVLGDYNISFH